MLYDFAHGEEPGVEGFISNNVAIVQTVPKGVMETMRFPIEAGVGGYPLVRTAEHIADTLGMLSEAGIDGLQRTWLDYECGLRQLGETVLPILKRAGLRRPPILMPLQAAAAQ